MEGGGCITAKKCLQSKDNDFKPLVLNGLHKTRYKILYLQIQP